MDVDKDNMFSMNDKYQDANELKHRHPSKLQDESQEKNDEVNDDVIIEKVELKRRIGLFSAIGFSIGGIIGSGIFIAPTGVAKGGGSVGMSLIMWTLCGVIAILAALSVVELGTMIPQSGGAYHYFWKAIGQPVAFLYAWTNTFMTKTAGIAILSLTSAEYFLLLIINDGCGIPHAILHKSCAVFFLVLFSFLNIAHISLAAKTQVFFTICKVLSLAIIIIGGLVKLGMGETQNFQNAFDGTNSNIGQIAIGLYSGMWAYDGWDMTNYITEELINPARNLPLAALIGILASTVLFVMTNLSYFVVMTPSQLIASPAVVVTWAEKVMPSVMWLPSIFVMMSTLGALNGNLYACSRIPFSASRKHHMPQVMSMIHVKRYSPLPAVILTTIVAMILIIPGNTGSLVDMFSFAVWTFYGLMMACVIILRFRMKDAPRPFKVPIICPILVLLTSLYLIVAPIIDNPKFEYFFALLFILFGLVFYFPFVHFKLQLPGIDKFTMATQLLFELAPPASEEEENVLK